MISLETVKKYLANSFEDNHFANEGPCVSELETIVREKFNILNTKAVIATCSGTAALHALICSFIIKKKCNYSAVGINYTGQN